MVLKQLASGLDATSGESMGASGWATRWPDACDVAVGGIEPDDASPCGRVACDDMDMQRRVRWVRWGAEGRCPRALGEMVRAKSGFGNAWMLLSRDEMSEWGKGIFILAHFQEPAHRCGSRRIRQALLPPEAVSWAEYLHTSNGE